MKNFFLPVFTLFVTFYFLSSVAVASDQCSAKEIEYQEFGLEIIKAVKDKNMDAFISLIKVDMKNGPRLNYLKTNSFDVIFPDDWIEKVVNSDVSCKPVGWRGYMLASGQVWYESTDKGIKIIAINGHNEEPLVTQGQKNGWRVEDKLLTPVCFVRQWYSGDNFETIAEAYQITNYQHFSQNIGLYLGKEITSLSAIPSGWDDPDKIDIVQQVNTCSAHQTQAKSGYIETTVCEDEEKLFCKKSLYRILFPVSVATCQDFSPNLTLRCKEAYVVEVKTDSGGSMGYHDNYYVYGLFDHLDMGNIIAPLKDLKTLNNARNFMDVMVNDK